MSNYIVEKCPLCGGNLKANFEKKILLCNYCGFEKIIKNEENLQEKSKNLNNNNIQNEDNNNFGKYDVIVICVALIVPLLFVLILLYKM